VPLWGETSRLLDGRRVRADSPSRTATAKGRTAGRCSELPATTRGRSVQRPLPLLACLATVLCGLAVCGPAARAGSRAHLPVQASRLATAGSVDAAAPTGSPTATPGPSLSPDVRSLQSLEIRDIGAPLPYPPPVWPWLAAAAVAVGSTATLTWWWRRRRLVAAALAEPPGESPPGPLWQQALARLDRLVENGLLEHDGADAFHVELTNVLRWYLDERFEWAGRAWTSDELVRAATRHGELTAEAVSLLKETLHRCDQVKFALARPERREVLETVDLCRRLVLLTREPVRKDGPPQASVTQGAELAEREGTLA